MVLVDTSVWIDHFRSGNEELQALLLNTEVACHPFIVGELSCGNLKNRHEILGLLKELPSATVAESDEVLELIETHQLMGCGIGWVDAHLLASAMLSGFALWTSNRRLRDLGDSLGVLR